MINDLPAGASVGPMTFNAAPYTIDGNALTLTGDLVNTSSALLILVPLKIGAPVKLSGAYATDKIDVNGQTLTIDGGFVNVSSLNGGGTVNILASYPPLSVLGDGTFNGTINGPIRLEGSMPDANVIIGDGEIIGEGTLGNVTLNGGDLQPVVFGVGPGVLHTGSLALNHGYFVVAMAASGPSSAVHVNGTVFLNCSIGPSVNGAPSPGQTFTIIDNDGTDPVVGTFIGAPEGTVFSQINNYAFRISYAGGDGNDVVLTTVGGTVTTLTQSPATTPFGDPFTVTVSVTSDAGTPGGVVTLYDGSAVLAIIPLLKGTATWTSTDREVGTHNITAIYQASHPYFDSASTVVTHEVQPRATTTTIGIANAALRYGDAATFTAVIGPAGSVVTQAGGTVSFEVDGVAFGSAGVANGSATLVTSLLGVGVHSVVAKYSGDIHFVPSASGALSQTVSRAQPSVKVDLLSTPTPGGKLPLRVVVSAMDHPSLIPTGNVTVTEKGAILAEQSLSGGEAVVTVEGLPAGDHQLVITFSGDSNFEPSTASIEPSVQLPRLSVSSTAIVEGNSGSQVISLLVQLSVPSPQLVRVAFTTVDGNARAGLDYEANRGVLEFPPGEIAQWVQLRVFGDTTPEPDQSFAVVLSDSTNADIGNGIGTVTILNDDGPLTSPPRQRPSRH
ncbi:MAG TPA: Ig-like domain repeat protein [Thermoanaerobaculia bacterium]|nr:Ig-like domain repeat protein [Thermoanaerobaculia bacterium]